MILAIDIGNTNIVLGCIEQETIRFEGRFEGGNLFQVAQLAKENSFEVYVNPDWPTPFHCERFNFRVKNL